MGEWHNMDAGCISSLDQFLFLHFLMASCGRCCDGCQVIAAVGSSRLPLRRCAGKATLMSLTRSSLAYSSLSWRISSSVNGPPPMAYAHSSDETLTWYGVSSSPSPRLGCM